MWFFLTSTESSDRVKAELGAMRSCVENGSTASNEIVNYRLTPVPTKRRHDDLTESEQKRVSTATCLQEEEKAHGEEDRQVGTGNVYSPGVLPTLQLLSEPTVLAVSITTLNGDHLALGPSIEHTSLDAMPGSGFLSCLLTQLLILLTACQVYNIPLGEDPSLRRSLLLIHEIMNHSQVEIISTRRLTILYRLNADKIFQGDYWHRGALL